MSGAIGVINLTDSGVAADDLPTFKEGKATLINGMLLRSMVEEMRPDVAIIERVATRPGQNVAAMGTMMYAAGAAYGVVSALGIPVVFVVPVVWKRALGLIGKDKEASRALAIRMFPKSAAFLKRKKDHGRAEALLLAHWGKINAAKLGLSAAPVHA